MAAYLPWHGWALSEQVSHYGHESIHQTGYTISLQVWACSVWLTDLPFMNGGALRCPVKTRLSPLPVSYHPDFWSSQETKIGKILQLFSDNITANRVARFTVRLNFAIWVQTSRQNSVCVPRQNHCSQFTPEFCLHVRKHPEIPEEFTSPVIHASSQNYGNNNWSAVG